MKPLKIAINIQLLLGGKVGGVEQFIIGLIHGLGELLDSNEEYLLITSPQAVEWLKQYTGPNQQIIKNPFGIYNYFTNLKAKMDSLKLLLPRPILRIGRTRLLGHNSAKLDRFLKDMNVDVVHFPTQNFLATSLPSIYTLHDIQHLHYSEYPEFFTQEDISHREKVYRMGCRCAKAIVVESQFVKDDITANYQVNPQKIYVIAAGPPTVFYPTIDEKIIKKVSGKFRLPPNFIFYPAQTWPHKNHIRLLKALSLLKKKDNIQVNLVCTGKKNNFWPKIKKQLHELHLEKQVWPLGFIEPRELRALYHLADFLIFPSLLEGCGLPILEAFVEGTPVVCSNIPPLLEEANSAALFFDPTSIESIASAINQMMTNVQLRESFARRGKEQVQNFTWERTAKTYRALYRKIAGYPL